MYAISAADAISPAIQRTRDFLFRPFRLGTFLKLCLVALITEGFGNNFTSSWNKHHHETGHHGAAASPPVHFTPEMVAAIVVMSVLVILLGLFISYLITRLRFAYFYCLIHDSKEIGPGWRLYRSQALRFFWMNLVVGVCFLLLAVLAVLPFVAGFWRVYRESRAGAHIDIGLVLSLILPFIPVVLLLVLAAVFIDLVLRDWMLPHYALENATAGQAWAAVWARISNEKAPFFLYAVLRILLPIAAGLVLVMAMLIPTLLFVAVTAGLEVGIHSLFAGATGAAIVVRILLQVVVGVIALGVGLLVCISLGGPLSTAVREYALLFYGGRYQALGDILFPPPPASAIAPGIV